MIKLIGALMIIGASTMIGLYRAKAYAERPRQIRQLIHAVNRLATEIGYGSTPLPDALGKLAQQMQRPLDRMFQEAAERLGRERNATVRQVWQETVDRYWGLTAMKAPEKEAFIELGSTLGVSDRDNQLKFLELAKSQLQHEEAAAREEQVRFEKLSRTLGVLGGALIVILIY
jgi:stage III sporulation protein AB